MFLRILIGCSFMLSTVHSKLQQVPEDTESVVGQEQVILKCRTDIADTANPVEWHHKANKDAAFEIVYKRGLILNGYRGRLVVSPNATTGQYDLIITGVKLQDAGAYTCMDRDSQSKAEVIVFERYPSTNFCTTNSPSDGFLGSNDCGLESDTVRMSCNLSYRGNLAPVLEWLNGETVIASTIVKDANGVTTSSVEQKVDQIQLQTATYTCRIKYLQSTNVSSLTWSTTLNITSIKNTTNMTDVGCEEESVDCSDVSNRGCYYTWLSENGTEVSIRASIKLKDKSEGNYTCLATRNIRQTQCSYVAKRINYQCNQFNNRITATNALPETDSLKICIPVGIILIVLIVVAVALVILAFLFRRMLCNLKERRCRMLCNLKERRCNCDNNDSKAEKGCHNYLNDNAHTCGSTLKESLTKNTKT